MIRIAVLLAPRRYSILLAETLFSDWFPTVKRVTPYNFHPHPLRGSSARPRRRTASWQARELKRTFDIFIYLEQEQSRSINGWIWTAHRSPINVLRIQWSSRRSRILPLSIRRHSNDFGSQSSDGPRQGKNPVEHGLTSERVCVRAASKGATGPPKPIHAMAAGLDGAKPRSALVCRLKRGRG